MADVKSKKNEKGVKDTKEGNDMNEKSVVKAKSVAKAKNVTKKQPAQSTQAKQSKQPAQQAKQVQQSQPQKQDYMARDLLFGLYPVSGVVVSDKSLEQYISFRSPSRLHTFASMASKQFKKKQINIVERLANKLMRGGTGEKTSGKVIRTHGRLQGKKLKVLKVVEQAFAIVAKQTNKNPLQVFIDALQNSAPREDVTRVSAGGVSYQIAVDVSAPRRLDLALRNIALAALMGSFNKPKPLAVSLASEIIYTAKGDVQKSYAMKKRDEKERMARSAR